MGVGFGYNLTLFLPADWKVPGTRRQECLRYPVDLRYPTANALSGVTYQGRSGTSGNTVANNVGAGKDSEASEAIIGIVDEPDPRPVWFCFWGDCSSLAQAIWKVQNSRNAAGLQTFLSKIRIHQIAHQDDTIDWLMTNFPDLVIIYSHTTYQGMFGGSDPISDLAWVNANIRNGHGPLGAVYPPAGIACSGVCEGDSPSYLLLVSAVRGLNNPEDPTQPSWGGMFSRDGVTSHYVDCCGAVTISSWRPQYQAEFLERADWMLPRGSGAPAIGVSADQLVTQTQRVVQREFASEDGYSAWALTSQVTAGSNVPWPSRVSDRLRHSRLPCSNPCSTASRWLWRRCADSRARKSRDRTTCAKGLSSTPRSARPSAVRVGR